MQIFGLACEGATDQVVLENILCGFYKDNNLMRKDIRAFQPLFDASQQKQEEGEFGGWEELLKYLSTKRFRESVINTEFMIIQIDTDISEHINFGVSQHNLSTQELIIAVIQKLISEIDSKREFYEAHKNKIIFAISVHSLECWILPIYKHYSNEKITKCLEAIEPKTKNDNFKKSYKNYRNYNNLSKKFLKYKELMKIKAKNSSFEIFINTLPKEI